MAPTREQDRHGTPILISDSPPRSPTRKITLGRIAKLPPRPPRVPEGKGTEEWVKKMQLYRQTAASGSSLALNSVNIDGQLFLAIPGQACGRGPPSVPPPIPNLANMVAGRPLRSISGARVPLPKYDLAAPRPAINKLPFNVEHSILCTMQKLMEESLFYWAKQWAPRLLEDQGWDTPEAGEFNHWLRAIEKWEIPPEAFSRSAGMTLWKVENTLRALHQVRHRAVHRRPTSIPDLKRFLGDAQLLIKGLRDIPTTNKMQGMSMALELYDLKAMEAIIAAPLSSFDDAVNFQTFQSQTRYSDSNFQQKENNDPSQARHSGNLQQRNSLLPSRGLRDRKYSIEPIEPIDLTMDSDDDLLAPGSEKSIGVIDLTRDEPVVLFRSARTIKMNHD